MQPKTAGHHVIRERHVRDVAGHDADRLERVHQDRRSTALVRNARIHAASKTCRQPSAS
jgi:hypothetical protein